MLKKGFPLDIIGLKKQAMISFNSSWSTVCADHFGRDAVFFLVMLCILDLGLDFVPAGSGLVDFGPAGFDPDSAPGSGPGLDSDLSGKHVEDCGKPVVLGAFSIATSLSINRKRSVNSFQSTSALSFCPIMTFIYFEKRSM